MGTQPEVVERALRGKPTLPKPEGEPQRAPTKDTSDAPVTQPDADFGEGFEGPGGALHTPAEEKRFALRGGRHNAASPEGKDRV
jgi:hypothetical protein